MSNQATIAQRTTTVRHNGQTAKEICVYDDYASGNILYILEGFLDDELELLKTVLEEVKDAEYPEIRGILDHVQENETGLFIEGTWYEWEQLKPIFDKTSY